MDAVQTPRSRVLSGDGSSTLTRQASITKLSPMAIPKLVVSFLILAISWTLTTPALALTWPQQIDDDQGSLTIYQPQPESLEGNQLSA
ncbi:MAG: hypothetical protein AAF680_09465, partial [Pseudomonadota bacterium]